MPPPKDPKKLQEYREKMSRIAKEKGYGKWMKGKKASDSTKEKMKVSQLAKITPEERKTRSERALKNGYGKWMKGKKIHPEVVEKTAIHRRGKTYLEIYGQDREKEERHKRKQGNTGRGKTYSSEEAKERLKTAAERLGKSYEQIYGEDRAAEEKEKRSASHLQRWQGKIREGCRDKQNGESKYAHWRKQVFARDDYTCQECGIRGGVLHAHHIKHWSEFPKLRYCVSNGVTLCPLCHSGKHPENKGLEASCHRQLKISIPYEEGSSNECRKN